MKYSEAFDSSACMGTNQPVTSVSWFLASKFGQGKHVIVNLSHDFTFKWKIILRLSVVVAMFWYHYYCMRLLQGYSSGETCWFSYVARYSESKSNSSSSYNMTRFKWQTFSLKSLLCTKRKLFSPFLFLRRRKETKRNFPHFFILLSWWMCCVMYTLKHL